MTEVEICGGGHRTRLRNQLVCLWGAPSPIYKGVEEGSAGRPASWGVPQGGNPTPIRSRFPPFLVQLGGEGKRKRGRRKGAPRLGCLLLSSTRAHEGPLTPRGVPVTPRYSGKYPIHIRTIPVSEYSLQIYQSLCLDDLGTPRHVCDLIQDSQQPSVHQITELIIHIVIER